MTSGRMVKPSSSTSGHIWGTDGGQTPTGNPFSHPQTPVQLPLVWDQSQGKATLGGLAVPPMWTEVGFEHRAPEPPLDPALTPESGSRMSLGTGRDVSATRRGSGMLGPGPRGRAEDEGGGLGRVG